MNGVGDRFWILTIIRHRIGVGIRLRHINGWNQRFIQNRVIIRDGAGTVFRHMNGVGDRFWIWTIVRHRIEVGIRFRHING